MRMAADIKRAFHYYGVHSVTIQPEYYTREREGSSNSADCLLKCSDDGSCADEECCPSDVEFLATGVSLTRR